MTCLIDLHAHSIASDGTLSPQELMHKAAASGVKTMALTDHDTTAGVAEAAESAAREGIEFVPGVEISVTWGGRAVHIVGLNVDAGNAELAAGLTSLREFRAWRAQEIGRRLEKGGISGAYEGAKSFAKGVLIGRTHFARFIVQQGHADSTREVFRKFLVSGKPGHVPGEWASLSDALGWIHAAGGQAVIAHPARYGFTRTKLRRLIQEFKDEGGAAIEVVSGSHSVDEFFTMAKHAQDFGLLASAGSDYHGPDNPWIELGKLPDLPHNCRPIWHDW